MPNKKIVVETDGDPKTAYEDTAAHERTGFIIDATEQLGNENEEQSNIPNNS
ncbi:hypothetical protein [Paenibacillus sp. LHD-38]|uniref:hypothetical protein n=1 Tax=Paenibacillus sp. LHD-38 TaxID=3072143 RepID=UPI0028105242|nr:hypothetical protein [Paenibacillus sp. LHD-38]MDQ8738066.1 hypothetical protein [Paenibacillus sp. LHD-38]